jgi:hypothetical protein
MLVLAIPNESDAQLGVTGRVPGAVTRDSTADVASVTVSDLQQSGRCPRFLKLGWVLAADERAVARFAG